MAPEGSKKLDRQLHHLLTDAPLAIYWIREDGRFGFVNRSAADMLGYSLEQLQTLTIFDVDADVDPAFWAQHWQDVDQAQSPYTRLEREHLHRDGTRIPVDVCVYHAEIEDRPVHVAWVRDLREEQQLAQVREAQTRYLQALFSDSPAPQLIIDPADGRIVEANPAAARFYGYSTEQLCAMNIAQLNVLPAEEIRKEMQLARSAERTFFRFCHRVAGGEIHDVHVYSATVLQGERELLHSTIQDVTPMVRRQQRLEQYQDLIDRLPIAIFRSRTEPPGELVACNRAAYALLEIAPDEPLETIHAADFYVDAQARARLMAELRKHGSVRRREVALRTRTGRIIWCAFTASRLVGEDGEEFMDGAFEDITAQRQAAIEIERAHARLFEAIDASPIPMMLHDVEGRVQMTNRIWKEITGYRPEQIQTIDDWVRLAHGPRSATVKKHVRSLARAEGRVTEGDFEIICADGRIRIWQFWSTPLGGKPGVAEMILSTALDVTDARAQEQRLKLSDAVFQAVREGITVTDAERRIQRVNPAFTRITGYPAADVIGRNPSMLQSGRQDPEFYRMMWSAINKHDFWQGEVWNRRRNGEPFPEWLSITAIRDGRGEVTHYAGVFTDLTDIKRSQSDLERLRLFDPLTALANRQYFAQLVDEAIEHAHDRPVTVLLAGLNRFRLINQSHSFAVGDEVLRVLGERLKCLSEDHLDIARVAGDQFAVLLRDRGRQRQAGLSEVLERLTGLIGERIELSSGITLNLQASIGIATAPADGEDSEELLRNAEAALFRSKAQRVGGTRHEHFDPDDNRAAQQRLQLEQDLYAAIQNDAIELHFQPVLDLSDSSIVAVEALARWQHPERGWVPPDEFIALAEEAGLIDELGLQLIAVACRAAQHLRQGCCPSLRIAFNVSSLQLRTRGFAARVLEQLAEAGLSADTLEVELTESVMMQRDRISVDNLERLREAGLDLSIDDFGTGFSSMAYLQKLQAHTLKIDRSFVQDLETSKADREITQSIVALAHGLGMKVIAEGVETPGQLVFLRECGCDRYQGYLFSRPLPLGEVLQLCLERSGTEGAGTDAEASTID
ncbi:MAG: EAL domain-containing protein [Wenzhouxiangellaceae bacterium]|nr:EAL domain-containing protein [Wenzhouxiangellaceae bacterium]